jgi:hypothetical protein
MNWPIFFFGSAPVFELHELKLVIVYGFQVLDIFALVDIWRASF